MKKVRAAVFEAPGAPFRMERLEVPPLQPGEVLARVLCTTVCASDLHSYFGRREGPRPAILGHEIVGEVVESRRAEVKPGQRITWSMVWSCGECLACARGLSPKCDRLFKFGHAQLGASTQLSGGMAEACILPAGTDVFPVPPSLPDGLAATANCATATVMAALRRAPAVAGRRVLIQGLGMLGLTACAAVRQAGAEEVYAFDRDSRRRTFAADFGATPAQEPAAADLVLDFTGHPDAIEASLSVMLPGAHLLLIGSVFPQRPLVLDAQHLVKQLLTVTGVYNYNPEDLAAALSFLTAHHTRYPFAKLIEKRFPLSAATEAFHFAENKRPVRVAILPE